MRMMKLLLAIVFAAWLLAPAQAQVTNIPCNQLPAITGDATRPAGSCATTLATVNANVGTFSGITVNGKGLVTAAVAPARTQSLPANPTGTASGVQVMAGLAGSFTPATSGNMFLTVQSTIANSTINDGCIVQMRFGTGGAPANGAAATGTAIGKQQAATSFAANALNASTLVAYQTGLVVSTVYWFDLGFAAVTGGTCSPTAIVMDAFEQ